MAFLQRLEVVYTFAPNIVDRILMLVATIRVRLKKGSNSGNGLWTFAASGKRNR